MYITSAGEIFMMYGHALRQKKTRVDHFIGHIPLLCKKVIKDRNQECLNISCPKQEKTAFFYIVPFIDRNHLLICFETTWFPQLLIDHLFGRWEIPLFFDRYLKKLGQFFPIEKLLEKLYVLIFRKDWIFYSYFALSAMGKYSVESPRKSHPHWD